MAEPRREREDDEESSEMFADVTDLDAAEQRKQKMEALNAEQFRKMRSDPINEGGRSDERYGEWIPEAVRFAAKEQEEGETRCTGWQYADEPYSRAYKTQGVTWQDTHKIFSPEQEEITRRDKREDLDAEKRRHRSALKEQPTRASTYSREGGETRRRDSSERSSRGRRRRRASLSPPGISPRGRGEESPPRRRKSPLPARRAPLPPQGRGQASQPQIIYVQQLPHGWGPPPGPPLPEFTPGDDPVTFINFFEKCIRAKGIPRRDWLLWLYSSSAGVLMELLQEGQFRDFYDAQDAINENFGFTEEEARREFRNVKIQDDESLCAVGWKIRRACRRWADLARATDFDSLMNLIQKEQFLNTLPREIAQLVLDRDITDLMKCCRVADLFVSNRRDEGQQKRKEEKVAERRGRYGEPPRRSLEEKWQPRERERERGRSRTRLRAEGRREPSPSQLRRKDAETKRKDFRCFVCREKGHTVRFCPQLPKREKGKNAKALEMEDGEEDFNLNSVSMTRCEVELKTLMVPSQQARSVIFRREIWVDGQCFTGERDTGTKVTVLPKLIVDPKFETGEYVTIRDCKDEASSLPVAEIPIEYGHFKGMKKVLIKDNPYGPILIGNDLFFLSRDREPVEVKAVTQAQARKAGEFVPPPGDEGGKGDGTNAVVPSFFPAQPAVVSKPAEKTETSTDRGGGAKEEGGNETWKEEYVAELQKDRSLEECLKAAVAVEKFDIDSVGKTVVLVLKGELLYRVRRGHIPDDLVWQLVVPKPYREQLIEKAHSSLWGAHVGMVRTRDSVTHLYYWPGVSKECENYCKTCDVCQRVGHNRDVKAEPMGHTEIVGGFGDQVCLDILGPLQPSKRGFQYLLVLIDQATRYTAAYPLKKITAGQVAKTLIDHWNQWGVFKSMVTDLGKQFDCELMKELCDRMGVKHSKILAAQHFLNPFPERMNHFIGQALRKLALLDPGEWDTQIPFFMFGYNATPHASLGVSPHSLVFGRELHSPLSLFKDSLEGDPPRSVLVSKFLADLKNAQSRVKDVAEENLRAAHASQKEQFDQDAAPQNLEVGDKVLFLKMHPTHKLSAKWAGPGVIKEKLSPHRVVVMFPEFRNLERVFHVNTLKRYHERVIKDPDKGNSDLVKPCKDVSFKLCPLDWGGILEDPSSFILE